MNPQGDVEGDIQGERIDDSKGRIFPCEGCGADLEFNIGKQRMSCPYCGHTKEIVLDEDAEVREQDYDAMLDQVSIWRHEKANQSEDSDEREVRCESCGFEVMFVGALTSTDCGYCGSPIQQDKSVVSAKRIPVDGVLPFAVTRELAQRQLKKWVSSRWFAPSSFTKNGVRGRFSGIYLPYWTYDSFTFNLFHYLSSLTPQNKQYYYVIVYSLNYI